HRNSTGLHRTEKAVLAILQQMDGTFDVFDSQIRLARDLQLRMTPALHPLYIMEQVDCAVLPAGDVLHHAHYGAIFLSGVHNQCWNGYLTERPESLQPPLSADQVVLSRLSWFGDDGDRALQPQLLDASDDVF